MAEEVKKAPRPVDPNSAKYKLGKIAADAYADAIEAKKAGKPVCWIASNFPIEIPETLGIATVFPENQCAAIAARGAGVRMCDVAESEGYSTDICAYARISLAYAKLKECPEQEVAMPDVLLCCSNICNCMIKWYENLSIELGVPMILIDIPANPDPEPSEAMVQYVTAQFWEAVHKLEDMFGVKWSDERFKEIAKYSSESSKLWIEATRQGCHTPSPFNGFDLMNHMAVMVTARGKSEAVEAMDTLLKEYKKNIEEGTSTFRTEEKYRIMTEGIACWPHLRYTAKGLKDRGINMVTTVYADGFGFIYDDFEGMIRAYCSVVGVINLEKGVEKRLKVAKDANIEGILVHNNRSCRPWNGYMSEMSRRLGMELGVPVISYDGDQADGRVFSEAQYDTRVQGLVEIMDANKAAKGE